MPPQEIFDTVATHLFTQGRRAFDGVGCVYRTPEGLSCAVGCLIPDDLYAPEMEGHGVTFLLDEFTELPDWFSENLGLLAELQNTHDHDLCWKSTSAMHRALTRVAREYGLSPAILDRLSFSDR